MPTTALRSCSVPVESPEQATQPRFASTKLTPTSCPVTAGQGCLGEPDQVWPPSVVWLRPRGPAPQPSFASAKFRMVNASFEIAVHVFPPSWLARRADWQVGGASEAHTAPAQASDGPTTATD